MSDSLNGIGGQDRISAAFGTPGEDGDGGYGKGGYFGRPGGRPAKKRKRKAVKMDLSPEAQALLARLEREQEERDGLEQDGKEAADR